MRSVFNALLSLAAIIYTVFYMSLNELTTNEGALSITGLKLSLIHILLAALQMQIALVDRLAEEIERINNAPVINRESKRLSHSLKQAEKQLNQYNDASDSLYLDWKSGEITKEEYRRLKGKIAEQMQHLEANIACLKEEMQAQKILRLHSE